MVARRRVDHFSNRTLPLRFPRIHCRTLHIVRRKYLAIIIRLVWLGTWWLLTMTPVRSTWSSGPASPYRFLLLPGCWYSSSSIGSLQKGSNKINQITSSPTTTTTTTAQIGGKTEESLLYTRIALVIEFSSVSGSSRASCTQTESYQRV